MDVRPYKHPTIIIPEILRGIQPRYKTLLDAGCGYGAGMKPVVSSFVEEIHLLDMFKSPPPERPLFKLGNIIDAATIFGVNSMEVVVCTEVIEHLEKDQAPLIFEALESVATKVIIFSTPFGFSVQEPELFPDAPWANNPYQKHLSGYLPEDFVERGYTVFTNGGTKPEGHSGQIFAYKRVVQ